MFFSVTLTIAADLGLGLVVAATHWLVKDKPASDQLVDAKAVEIVGNEEPLPIAA
jgi:hypothetical protein